MRKSKQISLHFPIIKLTHKIRKMAEVQARTPLLVKNVRQSHKKCKRRFGSDSFIVFILSS